RKLGRLDGALRASGPARVPVVLTREEVRALLAHVAPTYRLIADLIYGSGLRLLEALRLRVKDVDFGYGRIIVRDGKGMKRPCDDVAAAPAAVVARAYHSRQSHARAGPSARIRRGLSARRARAEISQRRQVMAMAICFPRPEAID